MSNENEQTVLELYESILQVPVVPKRKWYLETWFIAILFAFWFLIVPGIIGIILLLLQYSGGKKANAISELVREAEKINSHPAYEERANRTNLTAKR
ncbi:MAG: hypothetical protein LBN22_03510 [Clostridiales Family XIII bacterium]|jgi:hypothetical protein|nr:hypothetical protein [Clostridiales Family XIII bacterium]